jgi:hypothetical protein
MFLTLSVVWISYLFKMRRVKLLKELDLTSQTMVQGGLSSTTRMCGKPACPCHQDPAKRHGPNLYFTWRANGKGQALYVPPEHAKEARAAQAARLALLATLAPRHLHDLYQRVVLHDLL